MDLIKKGEEGDHVLSNFAPKAITPPSTAGSWSPVASSKRIEKKGYDKKDSLSDTEVWEKDINRQAAILESLKSQSAADLPPWVMSGSSSGPASGSGKAKAPAAAPPLATAVKISARDAVFSKPAGPSPAGVAVKSRHSAEEGGTPSSTGASGESGEAAEEVRFMKPATPPPDVPPSEPQSRGERDAGGRRWATGRPGSMKERERQEMDKFDTECETVYGILKSKFEIEMELPEIVESDGRLDRRRFQRLTTPNRAATGLNYTRLMNRFLKWRWDRPDLNERRGGFDAKMGVLDFVEELMQQQVGFLTPRSFLCVVDYFGPGGIGTERKGWQAVLPLPRQPQSRERQGSRKPPCTPWRVL